MNTCMKYIHTLSCFSFCMEMVKTVQPKIRHDAICFGINELYL